MGRVGPWELSYKHKIFLLSISIFSLLRYCKKCNNCVFSNRKWLLVQVITGPSLFFRKMKRNSYHLHTCQLPGSERKSLRICCCYCTVLLLAPRSRLYDIYGTLKGNKQGSHAKEGQRTTVAQGTREIMDLILGMLVGLWSPANWEEE